MKKMTSMARLQLIAGAALFMAANFAQAQYMWIDQKGTKQFSDQPPPASVPLKNILKAPRMGALVETPGALTVLPDLPGKSTADKEADYRKRKLEKAEADEKASAAASEAAQKKTACEGARARAAQLATGKRMRSNTPDRAFLDDNARARELAETNAVLAGCN